MQHLPEHWIGSYKKWRGWVGEKREKAEHEWLFFFSLEAELLGSIFPQIKRAALKGNVAETAWLFRGRAALKFGLYK